MDKKDSNSSSRHMCGKIKDAAVSVCPAFKAIRRITHRQSSHIPALPTSQPKSTPFVNNSKIVEIQSRPDPPEVAKPGQDSRHQKGELVRINVDYEKLKPSPQVVKVDSKVGRKNKANPEVESGKKTGLQIEDSFTNYISRARHIFRTSTFVGSDHGKGSKEQNDDENSRNASEGKDHRFTEFIDRAKKKFRTPSNVGDGRSISFK